jgi:hypothetical protein
MRLVGLRRASASFLLGGLLFAACERDDNQIKVYRLIKPSGDSTPVEPNAIASTNAPVKSTVERVPAADNVTTPPNWEPQPLSQMRQASFLVHGENGALADISFVTLGPAAGNVLENVNRWLGQLSQPPITDQELASTVKKLSTPRGQVDVVDLAGKPENGDPNKDGRIVAAIASDQSGTSFFKMRGNPELVGSEKPNFLKWVSSMCSGGLTQTSVASAPVSSERPQIEWEVPAGWSPAPASAMRYAAFAAGGDNSEKVDISVVTFPGDGGSDLSNINRWRQQIGLSPIETNTIEAAPLKASNTTFSTIDIAGANARTVAAWTRKEGRAWFFKLTGPNAAVEKEKQNFVKFVQSVRF